MAKSAKKIGLALSGGGVMGMAHVGVLKELLKHKIKIDAICGTSAGALIGLLFAIGGVEKIESFVAYLDGAGVFRKKFIFPGDIFKIVRTALEKYLGAKDFKELKIPFSCVATDLQKAVPVLLSKGNVIDAVMASAAYPGVFPTVNIEGRSLVDGGITKNLPATYLKEMGMDFVIGSSLHYIAKEDQSYESGFWSVNRFKIMSRALDIMQAHLMEMDLKTCDFAFTPPMSSFKWYEFTKLVHMQKIGEDYASKNIGKLLLALKNK
ncbi:MAG: patatin-like phospholipase family protein [Patescibacteria group bacterium]|nr:patatin-like phospholipase family protein [Patescibacteria group bacterium]